MIKKLSNTFAVVLAFIATTSVSTASSWMLYEPDVPECLKK